jgi:hypothetical protein
MRPSIRDRLTEIENSLWYVHNSIGNLQETVTNSFTGVRERIASMDNSFTGVHDHIANMWSGLYKSLDDKTIPIGQFLMLKEQSPELIHKFASGLVNDKYSVEAMADIAASPFQNVQHFIKINAIELHRILINGHAPLNVVEDNLIGMCRNPLLKVFAFGALLDIYIQCHNDNNRARTLNDIFDISFVKEDTYTSLKYISFLLGRKEETKALDILNEYLKFYPLQSIVPWIAVADLSYRNNLINDDIKSSHELFQMCTDNQRNCILENYLQNKTIAIVGNGPHDLGKGYGLKIDGYDIVVRFNRFNTSPEFQEDYGSKTNIVFTYPILFNVIVDINCDYIVTDSLYREPFDMDFLLRFKKEKIKNIIAIDTVGVNDEIQKKYNVKYPTTGLRTIYYLKRGLNLQISKYDVYGFALRSGRVQLGHYNDINLSSGGYHNLDLELPVLQDIFKD